MAGKTPHTPCSLSDQAELRKVGKVGASSDPVGTAFYTCGYGYFQALINSNSLDVLS
jgi:hypothetical protein